MGVEMNRAALERQMQDGLTSLNTELTQRCGQHDAEVSSLGSAHLSSRQAWGSTQPGNCELSSSRRGHHPTLLASGGEAGEGTGGGARSPRGAGR